MEQDNEQQQAKEYPYIIKALGKVIYQGKDYEQALLALLAFEKSEEYRQSVITFLADGSRLTAYPMRPDVSPTSMA